MIITTNIKGQLAVSKAEMRAFELGFIPSRPLYDSRYDLIIDDHKSLIRIQVKYANGKSTNSQGVIVVKLDYENRKKDNFTYNGSEVDALVVYIPKIDRLCYFPLKIFEGKRKLSVRIEKPKINQKKRIVFAKNYYW
ncbi:MAG: group I intron-associated PD-(D/E)XK endonuclease [Candidatus Woesebacteria bacterium]|nr:group I intron-associated PD-(D/E)XK endonuclease [Candidatus Woesebacteria bacterium]